MMRISLTLFTLLATTLLNTQNGWATSTVEYCPPYTRVAQLAVDVNQPFLQYSLTIGTTADGRKRLIIVADELRVSRDILGAIVRNAAAADATIGSIEIEARNVVFVDSLSLINADLKVLAKSIIFQDGAQISFLPGASGKLSFAAESIELADSGYRHFDTHARSLDKDSRDTFSDIGILLNLVAKTVRVGSNPVDPGTALQTLSSRFSRYPITDFAPHIQISVGASGEQVWREMMRSGAKWPDYSLGVVRAAFRVSPFDEQVRADVRARLVDLLPLLTGGSFGKLAFEAHSILDSIQGGVDLDGNGPAYSTNRPLSALLNDISGYAAGGTTLKGLDFYIAAFGESVGGAPISQADLNAQVTAVGIKLQQDTVAYNSTNSELTNIQSALTAVTASIDAQQAAYAARVQRLKDHEEELKQVAQTRAQVVSAMATAASIATTAYSGSPQAGSAVGGVIYAVGNASGGKSPIDSLSAGYQFAVAINGPLTSLKSTINDVQASRSNYAKFIDSFSISNITIKKEIDVPNPDAKPGESPTTKLTRDDALKHLGEDGTKLKDGVDGVLKVYNDFKPAPSNTPASFENDESLQSEAQDIAASLDQAKQLTLRLEALQRTAQEQAVSLVSGGENIAKLTNIPADNEARRRQFGSIALDGIRDELATFSSRVDQVRRVSIVEFRAPLPVDPAQVQSIYVMERVGGDFNPTLILDEKNVGQQYLALLKDREKSVTMMAQTVRDAATKQLYDFVDNQGRAPYITTPTQEFVDQAGSPPAHKLFMKQLKDLLTAQYAARNNPHRLAELQERQLEIPFDIRGKIDQRNPARLLQVAITKIHHSGNLSGGDLVFRIEREREWVIYERRPGRTADTHLVLLVRLRDQVWNASRWIYDQKLRLPMRTSYRPSSRLIKLIVARPIPGHLARAFGT